MTTERAFTWRVTESEGYETAWAELGNAGMRARGRAVGTVPEPYWISYELETGAGFVTSVLRVRSETAALTRELDLRRDTGGRWTANGEVLGEVEGALDCDLGLCPLTNSMPVLRHGLHKAAGEREFLMAWVSVPDLAVRPSRQTYTHLGPADGGGRVRFVSGTFRSELDFDAHGFVVDYPGMAHRITAG